MYPKTFIPTTRKSSRVLRTPKSSQKRLALQSPTLPSPTKLNQLPLSINHINTQAIPRPTKLHPIPRTHEPTLGLPNLSRRIRKPIPTETLTPILRPKNTPSLTRRRAPLNRQRRIRHEFPRQHPRGRRIGITARVRVSRYRGVGGSLLGAFEKIHAVAGAAGLGRIAGAFHGAVGGGGG